MVTSPWLYNATEAVALPGLALGALPSLSNNQTIAAPRSLFWPKAERTWSSAPTAASLLPLPPPADRCGSQKYPPSLLLHLPRRWRRAEPSAFVRIKAGVMSASIAPPARLIGGENAAAAPCRPLRTGSPAVPTGRGAAQGEQPRGCCAPRPHA